VVVMVCWIAVVTPASAEVVSGGSSAVFTVFLDPGHGDADSGATHRGTQGSVELREKDINLAIAFKAAELLRARGYRDPLPRD